MRKSGINIKPSCGFLRTLERLDEEIKASKAKPVPVAHVYVPAYLATSEALAEVLHFARVHHPGAVPVLHRMRREYERPTCLPGELGERIAS